MFSSPSPWNFLFLRIFATHLLSGNVPRAEYPPQLPSRSLSFLSLLFSFVYLRFFLSFSPWFSIHLPRSVHTPRGVFFLSVNRFLAVCLSNSFASTCRFSSSELGEHRVSSIFFSLSFYLRGITQPSLFLIRLPYCSDSLPLNSYLH